MALRRICGLKCLIVHSHNLSSSVVRRSSISLKEVRKVPVAVGVPCVSSVGLHSDSVLSKPQGIREKFPRW